MPNLTRAQIQKAKEMCGGKQSYTVRISIVKAIKLYLKYLFRKKPFKIYWRKDA